MEEITSSPDPLADEIPSSMRRITRRIASELSDHQFSSLSKPSSTPRRQRSAGKSPRKQTFELAVGNERSPQRLRVTVEAEDDATPRKMVSRRLFDASSPTGSAPRRRSTAAAATTTTTVPVRGLTDDEEGTNLGSEAPTPRGRGRPPKSRNGTPKKPRGIKRAGTPMRPNSRQRRPRSDAGSDGDVFSEPPSELSAVDDQTNDAPLPRTTTKKTPRRRPTLSVPSSKTTTAKKRGRPRKAMMPDEVAILTGVAGEADVTQSKERSARDFDGSEEPGGADAEQSALPDGLQGVVSPAVPDLDDGVQAFEPPSSPDNLALEPRSDSESEANDAEGALHSAQDNMTHASDFSMIAVESLPSFQASFQADLSGIAEGAYEAEMGDETNFIINQTLESLRQSTQAETGAGEANDDADEESLPMKRTSTVALGLMASADEPRSPASTRSPLRSPRRPKSVPLSRQVLTHQAVQADESFSSIPDQILEAATPGRPRILPDTASARSDDEGAYDDSFSEIPDVVLDAATPRPSSKRMAAEANQASSSPSAGRVPSSASRPAAIGSSRLPTPDDTTSSPSGSKEPREETGINTSNVLIEALTTSELNLNSTPPAVGSHSQVDFQSLGPQVDLNATTNPPRLSAAQAPAAKESSVARSRSSEPLMPSRRPTLSPIVRAGRTLQSVLTDKSSPEGGGSSLGSPFRGSLNGSRQSSVAKSPSQDAQTRRIQSNAQATLSSIASFAQSMRSNFGRTQRAGPAPVPMSDEVRSSSPHSHDEAQPGASKQVVSEHIERILEEPPQPIGNMPAVPSSTRAGPPTDDGLDALNKDPSSPAEQRSRRMSTSRINDSTIQSRDSSIFATMGSTAPQPMDIDEADHDNVNMDDLALEDAAMEQEPQPQGFDEPQIEEDADLWDIEASRPTPKSTKVSRAEAQARAEAEEGRQEDMETEVAPPRRSKIPSPWRRSGRRLIYQDEFKSAAEIDIDDSPMSEADDEYSLIPPAPQPQAAEQDEVALPGYDAVDLSERNVVPQADTEQYSMLDDQVDNELQPQDKPAASAKSGFFGGFDIMSFFSSPARIPPPNPQQLTDIGPTPMGSKIAANPPTSTRTSGTEEPHSVLRATGLFPSLRQKSFNPSPERRSDLFMTRDTLKSTDTVPDTMEAAPSTPEELNFEHIAQKRNFTPLSAQSRNTASLFTVDRPSTPPEQRSSSPDSPSPAVDEQEEGAAPSQSAGHLQVPLLDDQESSILSNESDLIRIPPREKPSRWDKTLSPSKSSFRSPLKPRTPGRVVEFDGSAPQQSPLEEREAPILAFGQARNLSPTRTSLQQSRRPAFAESSGHNNRGTSAVLLGPVLQASAADAMDEDKENSVSPEHSPERSPERQPVLDYAATAGLYLPAAASRSSGSALSQTKWTKSHWVRLDEMLQLRRRDPLAFQQRFPLPPKGERRSGAFLGKQVSSHGEKLIMQHWHLDVVDAFKHEVGGWTEEVLGKRIFALVIGEEQRRLGIVGRGAKRTAASGSTAATTKSRA